MVRYAVAIQLAAVLVFAWWGYSQSVENARFSQQISDLQQSFDLQMHHLQGELQILGAMAKAATQ